MRNGLHLTKAALKTFLTQDIGDVRVLFMDNLSEEDNTKQWLYGISNNIVRVMFGYENCSVAKSWNKMLDWTFRQGAEYALVCNNDVELRPDTYGHLVADGGQFVTAVGRAERACIDPPYVDPDPSKKREHPDFSAFLIRRECYKKVGKFDEAFLGGYAEDADYHIRMHRAGIIAECLELPFYHVGAGTIKNADRKHVREIQQSADKNRALFKAKWGVNVGSEEYYALFGHGSPGEQTA